MTNILNIKQNQIVKVFTIITAVLLPPTLHFLRDEFRRNARAFVGTRFLVLTLAGALLPLVYIKRKGWLR